MTVAIVLVSHSAKLAEGTAELAKQMAPNVPIFTAGGNDDGQLGTSLTKTQDAIAQALAASPEGVVVLADLGSAGMTVSTALELQPEWAPLVRLPMAPFVEGAVAAAVSAAGAGDINEVMAAATASGTGYGGPGSPPGATTPIEPPPAPPTGEEYVEHVVVPNALGIHARPAAALAKVIADSGVPVTVDGVDGASVLLLLGLNADGGRDLEIKGTGPGARDAVRKVVELIKTGFGEAV